MKILISNDKNRVDILRAGIRDISLSWKATGLLAYLTQMKGINIPLSIEYLAGDKTDGMTSLRSGFKELVKAGYLTSKKERDIDGKFTEAIYSLNYPNNK